MRTLLLTAEKLLIMLKGSDFYLYCFLLNVTGHICLTIKIIKIIRSVANWNITHLHLYFDLQQQRTLLYFLDFPCLHSVLYKDINL